MMDRLRKIFCMGARSKNGSDKRGLKNRVVNGSRKQDNSIPALFMDSDAANEQQIFIAAELYKDKPIILEKVLNYLIKLLSDGKCTKIDRALEIVFQALRRYLKQKQIQITASTAIYYIAKNKKTQPVLLSHIIIKQHVVNMLLDTMDYHEHDKFLVYYGCLALGEIKIDYDVTFEFKSLVKVSLLVLSTSDSDDCLVNTGLYLLGVVSRQVNLKRSNAIGDAGAVKILLALIKGRIDRAVCDDILEEAWATLRNIMNNTQTNCERFLGGNGMKYYNRCLDMFPEHYNLIEKLMGIMTCISEIKELRPRLLLNHFTNELPDILHSNQKRINVDSEFNIEQHALTAVDLCMDNAKNMGLILQHLSHLVNKNLCTQHQQILDKTLVVLNKNVDVKKVQHYGFAIISHILLSKNHNIVCDITFKQRILTTVINGMDCHKYNLKVMHYGYMSMDQLQYHEEMMLFEYKRLALLLIHTVSNLQFKEFSISKSSSTLNAILCDMNSEQKNELGGAGFIKALMAIIKDRLHRKLCDEALEIAWETLWNITDNTPKNSKRFLNGGGMKYFLECLKTFPDIEVLKVNMMCLLNNVADVKKLRPRLMHDQYIRVFYDLLTSTRDALEVIYNAAGVIVRLTSDGQDAWTIFTFSRSDVLKEVTKVIEHWTPAFGLSIRYRSLKPLLQLALFRHAPECPQFAVWGLANLIQLQFDHCSPMLIAEDGLRIMNDLINENDSMIHEYTKTEIIHSLATFVISKCTQSYQI